MRFKGPSRLVALAVVGLLGSCIAQDVPASDVDLESADDGASGSQQIFYTPDESNTMNSVTDPAQRRAREGASDFRHSNKGPREADDTYVQPTDCTPRL